MRASSSDPKPFGEVRHVLHGLLGLAVHVDGVARQVQRAVFEGRVAEAVAEGEQRRGQYVDVTLVDFRLGPPVVAAGLLAVVDGHLSDVAGKG